MTSGPLFRNIIVYSIPLMLTGILQLLFNAADLVVVGRYGGRLSIAAVGATGAIINLIVNLFIGLSVGVGVTVAVSLGAQDDERCSRAVHTSVPVALIGGAILTVVGALLSPTFLAWMKTPEDVIGLSSLYMRIYFCGMIPSLLFNYGAAILRAAGDTKHPLYYLMTAGVVNVCLNLFFVIALRLDVAGVALATILSQCLSATLILRFLMRTEGPYRFTPQNMKIHGMELKQFVRVGLPAGLQGSMFSISNVIIQSSVNSFGSVVMAGNSAAANIEGFTWIAMNSLHQSGMNFVGQNMGAHRLDRVRLVRRYCIFDVVVTGLVFGGLSYLFAHQLLNIYVPGDEKAISYGILRMGFMCLPYFLDGIMDVMTGIIRGLGRSMVPMIITVMDICVFRVVWIYTIWQVPRFHTLEMLYITYPITWILTYVMLEVCYHVIMRKLSRIERERGSNQAVLTE
ncbi:MAG: MATE family efflux transporter [Clostridia bacterium]|nr:MATE family efflux transporter [Clostridia bacterium]